MGLVDKTSTAIATRLYHWTQTSGQFAHKLFPVVRDRAQVHFPEIAPLTGLLVAEMYREGNEASKGHPPTMGRLITNMFEGGLSYLITSTVSTLYTIIGFLKGSYDAGKGNGLSEKTYAALKNGTLFLSGFLGVNIGVQYSHLMRQNHGKDLLKSLLGKPAYDKLFEADKKLSFHKVPNLTAFMAKDLETVEGLAPEMKSGLSEIRTLMDTWAHKAKKLCLPELFAKDLKIDAKNPATLRKMRLLVDEFETAQAHVLDKYAHLAEKHGAPKIEAALKSVMGDGIKDFHQVLRNARQYHNYELFRMMNPIFAYVLTIGFVGVPLVKLASFMLSTPGETPIDEQFGMRDTSLYLETFPRFQTHTGNIFANHGTGHGGSFPIGSGPDLLHLKATHQI